MLEHLLTNIQLTPEQRKACLDLDKELMNLRAHVKSLESKMEALEEQAAVKGYVLTRPEFNREVGRMLAYDERYGGISSILYFDISGLSEVNSRFGQNIADAAVQHVTQILSRLVRRSDIVGRLANDEYGLFLARCNNENAWKKGRQLAAELGSGLAMIDGKKLSLEVCFGAYTFREDENVAAGLKAAAEVITKAETKKL